jgi:hypothetical protein
LYFFSFHLVLSVQLFEASPVVPADANIGRYASKTSLFFFSQTWFDPFLNPVDYLGLDLTHTCRFRGEASQITRACCEFGSEKYPSSISAFELLMFFPAIPVHFSLLQMVSLTEQKFQPFERDLFVSVLRPLLLHLDRHACRVMDQPDSAGRFVYMLPAGPAGPEGCYGDLVFQVIEIDPFTGLYRIQGDEPVPAPVFGAKRTLTDPLDGSIPLPGELLASLAPDFHQDGSKPSPPRLIRRGDGILPPGEGDNAAFEAYPFGLPAEYVQQSAYDPFALDGPLARGELDP